MQRLPLGLVLFATYVAQGGEIRGAALHEGTLYTWGDELAAWKLPSLKPLPLLEGRSFDGGGCIAGGKLVLQEKGKAILFDPSSRAEEVFERDTRFASCLPFRLAGHDGILLTHLDAQLRFYVLPRFEMKELYSIYTASRQGGLLSHDVDGDGQQDVFWGNYWLRNPGAMDIAWRLFAINLWHDTPDAALAALAFDGEALVWAEASSPQARIARFEKPADPKQLWIEKRLPPLSHPKALLVTTQDIFVGHDGGVAMISRDGRYRSISNDPCIGLTEYGGRVYAVSPSGVSVLDPRK